MRADTAAKVHWTVTVVCGLVALVGIAILIGDRCDPSGPDLPPPPLGIDAGPGLAELDAREAQAEAEAEAQIEALEQRHHAALEEFDRAERDKYERVRAQGPDAVARWLTDFNRSLRESPPSAP